MLAAEIFTTLGHPGRLNLFRLLARRAPDAVPATELAEALGLKPNTLSVYVGALARAGLVRAIREGRSIRYSLNLGTAGELVDFLVADCCRGRPDLCAPAAARALNPERGEMAMAETPYNVLFICTGNSARSILAEALLRDLGGAKFNAYSAGTRPYSALNQNALDLLERNGHDVSGLHAKNLRTFQGADAPRMDFVFTVCDRAANEECPPWEGQPMTAHWGMPDPVRVAGTAAEQAYAFAQTYAQLRQRIAGFVALPLAQLDRMTVQAQIDALAVSDERQTTPV